MPKFRITEKVVASAATYQRYLDLAAAREDERAPFPRELEPDPDSCCEPS